MNMEIVQELLQSCPEYYDQPILQSLLGKAVGKEENVHLFLSKLSHEEEELLEDRIQSVIQEYETKLQSKPEYQQYQELKRLYYLL
ncbi:hypothetical protein Q73_00605 [Bacillus coahuilensis m2-6]|uniref:hypothetical protein n=1 Tax=Bacillus coahuilensis TaxID=408580 RepID=UPI0007505AF6|nr:hypothetical protein [Bacillus coahuilensis]KUP09911.1 hypothetical protein Q73_00605 [Bacillus coahuilensis m2-6]